MKKMLLICALFIGIGTGCTSANQWTRQQQEQWMDFCNKKFGVQKKNKSAEDISRYCVCVLDKIQGDYPSLKASLEMSDEKQQQYLQSCED